jgi:phosphoserine aminotransferase
MPKIFRLTKGGKLIDLGHFRGRDHQHAVDAVRRGLYRCAEMGEVDRRPEGAAWRAADANAKVLADWVAKTPWIDFLAVDPATRSNTSRVPEGRRSGVKALSRRRAGGLRQGAGVAARERGRGSRYRPYRDAPPGLRIWCGATIEPPMSRR